MGVDGALGARRSHVALDLGTLPSVPVTAGCFIVISATNPLAALALVVRLANNTANFFNVKKSIIVIVVVVRRKLCKETRSVFERVHERSALEV